MTKGVITEETPLITERGIHPTMGTKANTQNHNPNSFHTNVIEPETGNCPKDVHSFFCSILSCYLVYFLPPKLSYIYIYMVSNTKSTVLQPHRCLRKREDICTIPTIHKRDICLIQKGTDYSHQTETNTNESDSYFVECKRVEIAKPEVKNSQTPKKTEHGHSTFARNPHNRSKPL